MARFKSASSCSSAADFLSLGFGFVVVVLLSKSRTERKKKEKKRNKFQHSSRKGNEGRPFTTAEGQQG